jgi:hypothetical protein
MRTTGRLKDSTVINLPADWKGKINPDTIIVHLTANRVAQDLFVKSIDYGQRVIVNSQSGSNIDCYYIVEAQELSQG